MLDIVSEWVESSPDFLYATPHHRDTVPTQLLHPRSKEAPAHDLHLPITGIIQWCVLAPLVDESTVTKIGHENEERKMDPRSHSGSKETGSKLTGSEENTTKACDYQGQLARLHAEVLSALLSVCHTSSSPQPSPLTSDDVAIIVAALLAFSQKQEVDRKKMNSVKQEVRRDVKQKVKQEGVFCGCGESMEQCVERFAQFLQISLSTKILQLKPGIQYMYIVIHTHNSCDRY